MKKPTEAELKAAADGSSSIQMKGMNGDGLSAGELEHFAGCRALMTYAAIFDNYEHVDVKDATESQRIMLAVGAYFAKMESAQLGSQAKMRAASKKAQSRRIIRPS